MADNEGNPRREGSDEELIERGETVIDRSDDDELTERGETVIDASEDVVEHGRTVTVEPRHRLVQRGETVIDLGPEPMEEVPVRSDGKVDEN